MTPSVRRTKQPDDASRQSLAGATANAPGAELANSSHSHECLVGPHFQDPVRVGTEGEEELELAVGVKKAKKNKHPACQAAAPGETAVTAKNTDYSYRFLLDRLYQCHSECFKVPGDTERLLHEKRRWVMPALAHVLPHLTNLTLQVRNTRSRFGATWLQ